MQGYRSQLRSRCVGITDGIVALVLRGECNFVQRCATVNVRLQLLCSWWTVSFDTSKYGVVYYCIERVFHVVHLKLLLLLIPLLLLLLYTSVSHYHDKR